jgi:hypothetical protein
MKQIYPEELASPVRPGEKKVVFFSAGAAGAGKTTAIAHDLDLQHKSDESHVIFDGTLRPAPKAIEKIDQALNAGLDVHVAFIHRDPVEGWEHGVLGRAANPKGGGRTVMLDEYVAQSMSVQDSMKALQERYKDDPRFHMEVIDNSHGKGNSVRSSLDKLPHSPTIYKSAASLRKVLKSKLDDWYREKKITRKIYKATLGPGGLKGEVGM